MIDVPLTGTYQEILFAMMVTFALCAGVMGLIYGIVWKDIQNEKEKSLFASRVRLAPFGAALLYFSGSVATPPAMSVEGTTTALHEKYAANQFSFATRGANADQLYYNAVDREGSPIICIVQLSGVPTRDAATAPGKLLCGGRLNALGEG